MKCKGLILTCAFLLAGSTYADATNWNCVYTDESTQLNEFVDTDSIQKTNEQDVRKAWIKVSDKTGKGLFLIAVSKDGLVSLLNAPKTNTIKGFTISEDWEYIEPDSALTYAYDKIWPVKERKIKKNKQPNRWERKGENTAERAADRVINRALNHIGWGWGW